MSRPVVKPTNPDRVKFGRAGTWRFCHVVSGRVLNGEFKYKGTCRRQRPPTVGIVVWPEQVRWYPEQLRASPGSDELPQDRSILMNIDISHIHNCQVVLTNDGNVRYTSK